MTAPAHPPANDDRVDADVSAPTHEPVVDPALERQAALGLFARKVAHDLNNFATVIRTYSELLLSELPTDGTPHADVAEIHRAADAMVAYVQRIARFSRAGGMRPVPVDPDLVISDVVSSFATPDGTPLVRIDTAAGTTAPPLTTDRTWLSDVVREMVQNAREASPAGGVVTITRRSVSLASPEYHGETQLSVGEYTVVSVRDRGAGFADRVSANAEDPFVSTKDGVRGAGFGLTLAIAYAHAQNGRLTRERDGEETVVSLWLPNG